MDGSLAKADEELINSLSSLCSDIGNNGLFNGYGAYGAQLSQSDTLFKNLRWYLISNLRQLLSQLYVEHGIVQTLVEQPVEDAYRAGFEIKTGQLDSNEMEKLKIYAASHNVIESLMMARKWARLYGGGGVIIITDQDPVLPLDLAAINQKTPLEFRSCDMWELYYSTQNVEGTLDVGGALGANQGEFYDYYGKKLHHSRVIKMVGKEAPSFIRPRLRGWGMSELEKLVRSLNQYLKNQDVIFALLDEAKVDVYGIKGFNSALMTANGTGGVTKRIQLSNQLKDFNNALVMDSEDKYDQKQVSFSGLDGILLQIRQGLAADLKMPMTKLFGISSAGFNSGEDDIENYNSMVESEVRAKDRFRVVELLNISCLKLFGFMPDDLMVEFNPLRILNAKEEEEVKDSQFNRTMSSYQSGLTTAQEAKAAFNKDSLLPIEVDENSEAAEPLGGDFTVGGEANGSGGKQTKTEA